jgi:ubiquinol-cytochrome c reductase iron-sulfur subunit
MSQPGGRPAGKRRPGAAAKLWRALVALILWWAGWLRPARQQRAVEPDVRERHVGAPRWAERLVAALLALVGLAGVAALLLFVLEPDTQLLGAAFGLALGLLAAALLVASRWLVPQETHVEKRVQLPHPEEVKAVSERVRSGAEGITRRRLIAGAAAGAGAGLTAAVVVPVVALGPRIDDSLSHTDWRAGRRLVNSDNEPIAATDVRQGSFLTAFPEGADHEQLGSPVVVVRVDPKQLKLPAARADWAPEGILAFSKICTHAGCAISLYRSPLHATTSPGGPALVCPCHYSTFDVLRAGRVEFGPAGRPLPQLPLRIDGSGQLRAGGPLSDQVGPAWWGTKE